MAIGKYIAAGAGWMFAGPIGSLDTMLVKHSFLIQKTVFFVYIYQSSKATENAGDLFGYLLSGLI